MIRVLWTYDSYERHRVVALLLRRLGAASVLDVGGSIGLLSRFTRVPVTTLNTDGSGEIGYDGCTIPYPEGSFDAVVSLDTLEHVPRECRTAFVAECRRVARRGVIVAAPLGSPGHAECERRLASLHREVRGTPHRFLEEHVRFGLPTMEDVRELASSGPAARVEMLFAGDYRWQCRNFERALRLHGRAGLAGRALRFLHRFFDSALFHPIRTETTPREWSNRFYLVLEKEAGGSVSP